jgi:GPH family glycoside/pentoside/hexuronide:cation symporter
MYLAIGGGFVQNMGVVAYYYILSVLLVSVNDHIEYRGGFRLEGTLASSVIGLFIGLIPSLFAGVYETGLSSYGYDITLGINNPEAVKDWILFVQLYLQIFVYAAIAILLFFFDLEKKLPGIQAKIKERER